MIEGLIGQMPHDDATRLDLQDLAEKRARLHQLMGEYNAKLYMAYGTGDQAMLERANDYLESGDVINLKREISALTTKLMQRRVVDTDKLMDMLPMAALALMQGFNLDALLAAIDLPPVLAVDLAARFQDLLNR